MTEKEKLVELINEADSNYNFELSVGKLPKPRVEYEAEFLLKNGVIVPPCKVGDIVYYVYMGQIHPHKIKEIQINKFGEFVISLMTFQFKEFGKTVFLTKEEAEKALAEKRTDND